MDYLHAFVGVCVLILPTILAGLPDRDTGINQPNEIDALAEALLSKRLATERKKVADQALGETVPLEEIGRTKETLEKIDDDMTKLDITVGDKLIEQHIWDCKERFEIIVMKADGTKMRPGSCYMHNMEDELYKFACRGEGERPQNVYRIGEEVMNKEFLSQNGADHVCSDLPMFMISPADDDSGINPSSMRERQVIRGICRTVCRKVCAWKCTKICDLVC